MAVAPDGLPWFVEANVGNPGYRIGDLGRRQVHRVLPACVAASAPCSGAFAGDGLQDVAVASDGTLWYTDQRHRASVGRSGARAATSRSTRCRHGPRRGHRRRPGTIKRAVDGTLWFTVNGGYSSAPNAVVQINPTDLTKTVYPLGAALAAVRGGAGHEGQRVGHAARRRPRREPGSPG